ncbi:MAG: prepilin-type N-terminal cleavage/methylation domain-containing protein [Gammaproteobacteria bacterium]|nr:prepilin-type N-terminal cleavage/methylation domain-containing protein [Gammaproteobacteria bacterium]
MINTKQSGFTLIELIIVIIILGIVAAIGSSVLYQSFRSQEKSQELIETTWQARVAIRRLSQELFSITLNDFTPATHQITFKNIWGEMVTYSLDTPNHTLKRNTETLANNVNALDFFYYDENNTAVMDLSNPTEIAKIRCIKIQISIEKNNAIIPLQTIVCPRNFL